MARRRSVLSDTKLLDVSEDISEEVSPPTFAEAKGTEANQHAKKLAQAKSKKEKTPSFTVYTQKGVKIMKLIVKPGKTYSVYVGQLTAKKHKDALEPMIKNWKAEGVWFGQDELKEKLAELQLKFKK